MRQAMALAEQAAAEGEVPVGCVILRHGEVIATGRNRRETQQRPTGHAEIDAIDAAARALGTWRLDDHRDVERLVLPYRLTDPDGHTLLIERYDWPSQP